MADVASNLRTVILQRTPDFPKIDRLAADAGVSRVSSYANELCDCPAVAAIVYADGTPHREASQFLASHALLSRGATSDSVRTYAECLLDWMRYLDSKEIPLSDATEECLNLYRSRGRSIAGRHKGSALARSTVSLRVTVAAGFHRWSEAKGVLRSPLGKHLLSRPPSANRRFGDRRFSRSLAEKLTVSVPQRLPTILNVEQLKVLVQSGTPQLQLMLRWSATTGMRRFEICQLTHGQIADALRRGADHGWGSVLVNRKGGRALFVHVPWSVLVATEQFINWSGGSQGVCSDDSPVFLGARGGPFNRSSYSRAFKLLVREIASDATLHHLRHTFAISALRVLDGLESRGVVMNSLKTLQVLLGHASVESTEIYIRAMETTSKEVMEQLSYLYGGEL